MTFRSYNISKGITKLKPKSSSSHAYNARLKKIPMKNNQKSKTLIEDLSNECFYEIFDYLDGIDTYSAFSNLNQRFQQLLNLSSILYKIKLHYPSDELYENFVKKLRRVNRHQIFSLHLHLRYLTVDFFSAFIINSSLNRLESLNLTRVDIDPVLLKSFFSKLSKLPCLSSLTITTLNDLNNLTDIYRIVFKLPMLKYCNLSMGCSKISSSMQMATHQQSSGIERLVVDHSCTFNELAIIISYTPKLSRLCLKKINEYELNVENMLPITLANLTHLSLHIDHLEFDEIEYFIKKIESKVKVLSVNTEVQDDTYLDGEQWEQLFSQSLPHLEEFYLEYYESIPYKDFEYDESDLLLNWGKPDRCYSPFWMTRQWICEVKLIHIGGMIFSVHPYRKRWYDYDSRMNLVIPSDHLSQSTQMTIMNVSPMEDEKRTLIDISYAVTFWQCYHLEILEEQISIDDLIQILNLLPELKSFKINSLLLDEPSELWEEEVDSYLSSKETTKITKVYLCEMFDLEEVYFLMALCPFMEYLKIGYINNMDTKSFIRKMIKRINDYGYDYLRSLCFHVSAADGEMVKKLDKMIRSYKLLVDYSIRYEDGDIYLEWK